MTIRREGTVVGIDSRRIWVEVEGERIAASARGLLKAGARVSGNVVAVGDRVRLHPDPAGAVVEEVEARRNVVARADPGDDRRALLMAANLDRVVVVVSARLPRFQARALDRLLIVAECAGVPPLVACNKMDLVAASEMEEALAPYRSLAYPVHEVSALHGLGCPELASALTGRISLLLGASGVGKSALINRLVPGSDLRTGPVSAATSKGVHTTTRVEWIRLPGGGVILDAPGIRSIQPWGLVPSALASHFPEMRRLAPCRFRDCLHLGEPGCEVLRALAEGRITASRHDSYVRLLRSLAGERPPEQTV